GPRQAIQLYAHAHDAHVVDVRRDVRAGTSIPHPRAIRPWLREDAASHVRRQVVADAELGADDTVRLGISSALKVPRLPQPLHLGPERRDDVLVMGLLVRLWPLLGDLET